MARRVRLCLAAAGVSLLLAFPAAAKKRVALVVGNSAYVHAGTLVNAANDARDMAAALSELTFDLILGLDLDKQAFDAKVRDFSRALAQADTALFFYAGRWARAPPASGAVWRIVETGGARSSAIRPSPATLRSMAAGATLLSLPHSPETSKNPGATLPRS
jgi:Caspase domain